MAADFTEPNLAAMMFARAARWPRRPMLRAWRNGAWTGLTWGEFATQAASAARALRAAGIAAGDRVLIVSENRPEYPIAEVALMAIRAVPVPAYTTATLADHAHTLRDSGARAAIVSTAALAATVAKAGPLDLLVSMEPCAEAGLLWADCVRGRAGWEDIAAEAATIAPGALACLIYTSGTGGAPRGVMLPHRAILANCAGAAELVRPLALRDEVYLSFLPLSHAYEHTAGQFFLLGIGCEVVYARGIEHLTADMAAVRPTIMTFVPRILEVIRARVLASVGREPPWRQRLFHRAVALGRKRQEEGLTLAERAVDAGLERLVRRKVRARFGGRFRTAMSGGARLDPALGRFFMGLGIELLQGYGQTEAGPVVSANTRGAADIETVGRPLAGVEVRIAEDGEILIRGDLVMDGYWGRPIETAEAIHDGWLHTGDIGVLDARGFPAHHRPQARHDRAVGRRERLAGADRGHADERARDRAGGRGGRRAGGAGGAGGAGRGGGRGRGDGRGAAGERGAVGDRAHPAACAGGGVHDRERAADREPEGAAAAGAGRAPGGAGGALGLV